MHLPREVVEDGGLRPLTRSLYHLLVDSGAFEGEHIELIRGVLVTMSSQGTRHGYPVVRLNEILLPKLLGRAQVRIQLRSRPTTNRSRSRTSPSCRRATTSTTIQRRPGWWWRSAYRR